MSAVPEAPPLDAPYSTAPERPEKSEKKKKKGKKKHKEQDQAARSSVTVPLTRSLPVDDVDLEEESASLNAHSSKLGSLFILSFLVAVDFSMVLPGMYPMIKEFEETANMYGIVFTAYSVGQIISALILGYCCALKSMKSILIVETLFLIAGNALYCAAAKGPLKWLLVAGRGLCGIGGGISIFGYSHLAKFSSKPERASRFALFRLVEILGSVVAPALGALSVKCSFLFFGHVTEYNVPALIMIFLLSIFLIFLSLERLWKRQRRWRIVDMFARSLDEEIQLDSRTHSYGSFSDSGTPREIWSLGLIFLAMVIPFWAFLASFIPLATDKDWSLLSNYYLFVYIGILSLVTFAGYKWARPDVNSTRLLLSCLLVMLLGAVGLTDFLHVGDSELPTWQLYTAATLLVAGFCIGTVQLPSMFARFSAPSLPMLASKTSRWFALVSSGRWIGSIWGALAYDWSGMNLISHSCAVVLVLGLLVGFCFLAHPFAPPANDASDSAAEDAATGRSRGRGRVLEIEV